MNIEKLLAFLGRKNFTKGFSIFLLGVVMPIAMLFQAYTSISKLDAVSYKQSQNDLLHLHGEAKQNLKTVNDYYMFSLLLAEHANQKTMINKQIMKTSVMQIGFAVISIGIMFIVLGINDGGAEALVSADSLSFNFKTGSTGAIIFVVGALMAMAGGIIKNEYNTVPIPDYAYDEIQLEHFPLITVFERCKKEDEKKISQCIAKKFSEEEK